MGGSNVGVRTSFEKQADTNDMAFIYSVAYYPRVLYVQCVDLYAVA